MEKEMFNKAVEAFIDTRINYLGESESEGLQAKAFKQRELGIALEETFTPEQMKIWSQYASVSSLIDGDTLHEYYTKGIRDGINLILKLGGWDNE